MTARRREELESLRKLREVAALLADEPDARKLVTLVLDQAIELVGAERGFVILTGRGTFDVAAARNVDHEEVQKPEFKVSRSIVQRVAASGRAELIVDAVEDPATRDLKSVQQMKLRSILCVPLRAHGHLLGVVYVDHRYSKGEFDKEDLATLEAFSVPAGIALEAARREAELTRHRDELKRERDETARRAETIERLRAELAERYRERSREANRLRDEAVRRLEPTANDELPGVVARSGAMKRVLQLLRKVAPSDAPVLVLGESGVGKEVLARAVHALSARRGAPFLAENCGALADPLLESELFGHEAGAFTGAQKAHRGLFEAAHGGTLLLDEVGEMSPSLQAKLLRVLQEGEIRRVGGEQRVPVNVRIIAATHRDLEAMVAQGTFRADLFYRLNVVRLEIPPLRERPEDVAPLLDRFLERSGVTSIEPQAREILLTYPWPGNVRQLENEVKRLAVLAGPGGTIRPGLLSPAIVGAPAARSAAPEESGEEPIQGVWELAALEKVMIERALRRARGNKTLAAKLLGLPKSSLYDRLEKHGLQGGASDVQPL